MIRFAIQILSAFTFVSPIFAGEAEKVYGPKIRWIAEVEKELEGLEKAYPNQIGVFIKRLSDDSFISHRGEELFYVSAGVKLPVAIEVLRQVDQKKIDLQTGLTLASEDYVDGRGSTNLHKPGSKLTVQFLLEQMMIYNDNTANDVLIKRVGIEPINTYLRELVPAGFERITTIADIRRMMYAEIHPSARNLKSNDLLALNIEDDTKRLEKVREILKLKQSDLLCQDISSAFQKFYATNLNSATLKSYVHLLEQLATGGILSDSSQRNLLNMMKQSEVGKERLIAGLPKDVQFADKTGSQRARICDFGIAWKGEKPIEQNTIIITMCVRDYSSKNLAEAAFRKISEALTLSGVFN